MRSLRMHEPNESGWGEPALRPLIRLFRIIQWHVGLLGVLVAALLSGSVTAGDGTTAALGVANCNYAEIQVVDAQTGRGVPLVALKTVNGIELVTDNAGRIAIAEPGLMDHPVFFFVSSHGYEFPADPFGFRGTTIRLQPGKKTVLKIQRQNIAERLYRITGEGLYRDSLLLGYTTPLEHPLGAGQVAGQDSAFSVPYRGRVYWFWGDTSRLRYPLGNFWMSGATSLPPDDGGLAIDQGVNLNYFVDAEGFSRPMCRLGVERGPVWADCFAVVQDATGRDRLVCHYNHMASLGKVLDHGLAVYDDEREQFVRVVELPLETRWPWPPQSHPVRYRMDGVEYLLLGEVYPTVRVPATFEAFLDPQSYESWTCLLPGSTEETPRVDRGSDGRLRWRWRRGVLPVNPAMEKRLVDAGLIQESEARGRPRDPASNQPIYLHRGSVNWNRYRKRWIMIACQQGGTSFLGEIWYSEADAPTGPWKTAVKVVTHEDYSFYNPVHHAHFDQAGGRLIYFEGTYTKTFSSTRHATPRYDYNQIMYRLDLADPRLRVVASGNKQ